MAEEMMGINISTVAKLLTQEGSPIKIVTFAGPSISFELRNGSTIEFNREHVGFDFLVVRLNGKEVHRG